MQNQIEVIPLGGHSDFGRNMTAVRVGREIVIFDMGVKLDPLQALPEGEGMEDLDVAKLRELEVIADDRLLEQVDGKVVAIVISHAHTDHVGAVARLAGRYPDAPIIGSPYTIRYVEDLAEARGRDRHARGKGNGNGAGNGGRLTIPNRLVTLTGKDRAKVGRSSLEVELVHVTHSIVGSTIPVLHTPKGAVVYALDFKLDDTPVIGAKPDYRRLAQIGRDGVHLLITEATNAAKEEKTDSESVARMRLRDLFFGVDHHAKSLFVTTFSSNSARMHSIMDYAQDLDREVLLLGRSIDRYQAIAADLGILQIPQNVQTFATRALAQNALKKVAEDPERYLVVLTGHQGEPGALLTRVAADETPYRMTKRDHVIFSSNVIPTETCIAQRADLEAKLHHRGARLFKGAHVSGHASAVDHQEMLHLLQPEHIVPAHGGLDIQMAYAELAAAEGYRLGHELHVLKNGERFLVGKDKSRVPRRNVPVAQATPTVRASPKPAAAAKAAPSAGRRRTRGSRGGRKR